MLLNRMLPKNRPEARSSMIHAQPFPLANAPHIHFITRSVCALFGTSDQFEKRVTSGIESKSWTSPQSSKTGSRKRSRSVRRAGNSLFTGAIAKSLGSLKIGAEARHTQLGATRHLTHCDRRNMQLLQYLILRRRKTK